MTLSVVSIITLEPWGKDLRTSHHECLDAGAVLGWVIMQRVAGQRAQYVMFKEPATGRLLPVSSQPSIMLRWAVQKYPVQVCPHCYDCQMSPQARLTKRPHFLSTYLAVRAA